MPDGFEEGVSAFVVAEGFDIQGHKDVYSCLRETADVPLNGGGGPGKA
jgi:hypothetical protein